MERKGVLGSSKLKRGWRAMNYLKIFSVLENLPPTNAAALIEIILKYKRHFLSSSGSCIQRHNGKKLQILLMLLPLLLLLLLLLGPNATSAGCATPSQLV